MNPVKWNEIKHSSDQSDSRTNPQVWIACSLSWFTEKICELPAKEDDLISVMFQITTWIAYIAWGRDCCKTQHISSARMCCMGSIFCDIGLTYNPKKTNKVWMRAQEPKLPLWLYSFIIPPAKCYASLLTSFAFKFILSWVNPAKTK